MNDNQPEPIDKLPHEASPKPVNGELIARPMGPVQALASDLKSGNGRLNVSFLPDPIGLFRSFRRRWLVAPVLGTVFAAAAGATTWFAYQRMQKPRYTVYALLRMSSSKPYIAYSQGDNDASRFRDTQLALITSKYALGKALHREDIRKLTSVTEQSDPIDWLAKSVRVGFVGRSDLLRISIIGERPDDLIRVVNAVKDAYLDEVVNADKKNQLLRIAGLEKVHDEMEERLRVRRVRLEEMAKALGGTKPETLMQREKVELDVYAQILRERTQLAVDLIKAEADLAIAKRKAAALIAQEVSEDVIERALITDQEVATLRAHVGHLEKVFAGRDKVIKNKADSALIAAKKELEDVTEQLHQRECEVRVLILDQIDKLRGADVAKIEERIQSANDQAKIMDAELELRQVAARTIGTQSLDVEFLREEIAQIDGLSKGIQLDIEKLRVETDAPSRVTDYEPADSSHVQRDGDRIMKVSGMATVGTFAFVVLAICWWDFSSHRVDRPDQVEGRLGLKIIGTIPALPNRLVGRSPSHNDQVDNWFHFLTESVDCIRAQLLHEARISGARVFMLASAVGREGKTTLSCHLAASLARTGRRVLLVDGDMRRPTSHRLLNQELAPGLAEVLRREVDWRDALRTTTLETLRMIPAGEIDNAAIRELSKDSVGPLFDEFRGEFDFIIVDSPPVLPVSDALSLGRYADGVIFSIMHEMTQLSSLNEAHERMASLGIRILGAIVNGARGYTYGYNYRSRYYGYGYRYPQGQTAAAISEEKPA